MCFGSGTPKYTKPDFGPLPSLSVKKGERRAPKLEDVQRQGLKTRSLLNPKEYEDASR